jgi:hypothetical protein
MPKNRQIFHDPLNALPPVVIEILKGDVLRFSQIDGEGRTNVVTFSDRLSVRRGVSDAGGAKIR